MDNNDTNLLKKYGLSACPSIREITLPFSPKIMISDDNELCLVSCGSRARRVNILSRNPNLEEYKKFIDEICRDSHLFLCARNIKLNNYIPCEKIDYGFYYKFRAQIYETTSFVSAIVPEIKYSLELEKIFLEQKKISAKNNLENWLLYDAKTISVTIGEKLAGFIVLSKYYNDFFINFIYVYEQYRKHGIGSELLKYASNFVYENKCNHFFGMSPYRTKRFYKALKIESLGEWVLWEKKL